MEGFGGKVKKKKKKRPVGRPRRTCEDNIKLVFRETGWGSMDWNDLAQDSGQERTLVNKDIKLRIP